MTDAHIVLTHGHLDTLETLSQALHHQGLTVATHSSWTALQAWLTVRPASVSGDPLNNTLLPCIPAPPFLRPVRLDCQPETASAPSRTRNAAMTSPAAGSAHQSPQR